MQDYDSGDGNDEGVNEDGIITDLWGVSSVFWLGNLLLAVFIASIVWTQISTYLKYDLDTAP